MSHKPVAPSAPQPLLTAKDVMSYLRIGRTTLYHLTKAGEIPFYKVGGELRFKQNDLDHYLERMRRTR